MCIKTFAGSVLDIPVSRIDRTVLRLDPRLENPTLFDDMGKKLEDQEVVSTISQAPDTILQVRKAEEISLLVYYISGTVLAIVEVYLVHESSPTRLHEFSPVYPVYH